MKDQKIYFDWIRENRELIAGLVIFWITFLIMLIISLNLNDGNIVYSLDDAYIHMAIAKNFAQRGVWGITKKKFSSSSSSILYSLLLSFFFLFGPNEIVPLIINLIFANLLIFFIHYVLKKNGLPSYAIFVALILIIFFIPIPFLIFTGMEHIIQIFIDLMFVYLASNILIDENIQYRHIISKEKESITIQDKFFFLIIPLVSMIRFEGMFFIFIISLLFLVRKKIFYSGFIMLLGFLPIIIFGLISMSYGWYFFPNPVVLKGNIQSYTDIWSVLRIFDFDVFIKNPNILVLILAAAFFLSLNKVLKKDIWRLETIFAIVFVIVSCLHLLLIGAAYENQNLSRYEGYLIALGIVVIFLYILEYIPQGISLEQLESYVLKGKNNSRLFKIQLITSCIILFFLFYTFIPRSIYLIRRTPQATNNIYEQQYQMGLFLQKYYEGECIAVNDIGAVNYLSDIECLDLRGLGSDNVARALVNDELDEEFVYKAAERHDCVIAIIYEDKDYGYDIPSQWTKVGEWELKYNVVCGDDTVSFWAVDPDEINDLMEHLEDFSRFLPNNVIESGNYTK